MSKKILLIRSFVPKGTGGPVPPLELLYVASHIKKIEGVTYDLCLVDTGITGCSEKAVLDRVRSFSPDIIIINALAWEAQWVHLLARMAKGVNPHVRCVVFGQLVTCAREYLCIDKNIDFAVIGEPEITIGEFLETLEGQGDFSGVNGLAYMRGDELVVTSQRSYVEDLDNLMISPEAWGLIDLKAYAKYSSWSGALKEDFYIPILTSRGCPFACTYCRENYYKHFRSRSPESVINELRFLKKKYDVKEIHIYDAVFNYDIERAKNICQMIIDSGMDISLSFPHGIRADVMTDEMIKLLREAGTYKLVYGIETASSRLQKHIRKNLDLEKVRNVIRKTSQSGIITGGYFMMGFPTETEAEMKQTIDYAVHSDLDVASFFKFVNYEEVFELYKGIKNSCFFDSSVVIDFGDFGYYSVKGSSSQVKEPDLNRMIVKAQQRFYLNFRRFFRGIRRYPHKGKYIKNFIKAAALILQAYLVTRLADKTEG